MKKGCIFDMVFNRFGDEGCGAFGCSGKHDEEDAISLREEKVVGAEVLFEEVDEKVFNEMFGNGICVDVIDAEEKERKGFA